MTRATTTVRMSIDIDLPPEPARAALLEELPAALAAVGLSLSQTRDVVQGQFLVGRPRAATDDDAVRFDWHQADWDPGVLSRVAVRFEPIPDGTRIVVEHEGWGGLLADRGGEAAAWFTRQVLAPLFAVTAPRANGDWLVDRIARNPRGELARRTYADPLYHRPGFRLLLRQLAATASDNVLEIGCGGGVLLRDLLRTGCRATGIDHSPDMVATARSLNAEAIAAGRLQVLEGTADDLPLPDQMFTAAVMANVFFFLPHPVAALREARRVLVPSGRLLVATDAPEAAGTIAAPPVTVGRSRLYPDEELRRLAQEAGFERIEVERPSLADDARAVGIPREQVPLFEQRFSQLLRARR
jgi:SAM-dependent methyltransferase